MENKKIYDTIAEAMDPIPLEELPSDRAVAIDIVGKLPDKEALQVISEYTRYVANRTYEIVK